MAKYTINGQEVTEDYFKQNCTHQGEINYLVFPLLSPPKKEGNNKKLHHIATIKAKDEDNTEKLLEGFKALQDLKKSRIVNKIGSPPIQFDTEWKGIKFYFEDLEKGEVDWEKVQKAIENSPIRYYTIKDTSNHGTFGKKESEGKLPLELDFDFIKQMAERMAANKANSKYKKWNWKNSIEVEKLLEACMRHMFEIMEGRYDDDSREFGHLEAVATGMMMVNYQLKNLHNKK